MAVPITSKGHSAGGGRAQALGEGFSLEYRGKKPEMDILGTRPGVFKQSPAHSGSNRLYHGDNLAALAALAQDCSVAGKVRVVYIDPPFATDASFESRTQVHAYTDHLVGPAFVESLRERLILLHRLLADNGSLYLHLDGRMIFHMKVILDEIFGASNFRNCITRKKCNPKNYTRNTYGNVSDYILFYSKSDSYIWNRPFEPWTGDKAKKEYPCLDELGRRYKKVPVHAPGIRNGESGGPWRGKMPPPGKHWQYIPATLDEMDARGEIYWSPTGNPRRKIYLEVSAGLPVQDIWLNLVDAHNQNIFITGYPTEKNPSLLARIIGASSNPGDLVLDCYAGSGTTLVVAESLGRKWIGVDRSLEAVRTMLQRFELGTERMGDFVNEGKSVADKGHHPVSNFVLFEEIGIERSAIDRPQCATSDTQEQLGLQL